jgi:RHS repeat-associated protein
MTAPQRVTETGLIRKQAIAHNSDYGETTQTSGSANVYNPFLYTGQELDKETGFYHLRARHYAPSLGKFLSRDPIGYAGGPNLYSYCGGDPINCVDPSGLEPSRVQAPRTKQPIVVKYGVDKMPGGYDAAGTVTWAGDHLVIHISKKVSKHDLPIVLANERRNANDMLAAWKGGHYAGWTPQQMMDSEIGSFIDEGRYAIKHGMPSDPALATSTQKIVDILNLPCGLEEKKKKILNLMASGKLGKSYQDLVDRYNKAQKSGQNWQDPFEFAK